MQVIAPLPRNTIPVLRNRPRMDADSIVNLGANQFLLITEVTNARDSADLSAESWLKVSICGAAIGESPKVENPNVTVEREPAVKGWIERSVLMAIAQPIIDPAPALTEACTYAQTPSSPSPFPSPAP
ncbi:MAG: hypothetical protein ACFCBU_00765 [Cyanophyceae cyanobacterium]